MGCCSSSPDKGGAPAATKQTVKETVPGTVDQKQQARRENAEYIGTLTALSKVPLLRRLPKDQHPMLAAGCQPRVYSAGKTVIKQGDFGSEFFLIRSGEARVLIEDGKGSKPKEIATVHAGDYFGEKALLRDEPRNATIEAASELTCLVISREKFQELGLHLKLEFAKRQAVMGTRRDRDAELVLRKGLSIKQKTPQERDFIMQNLRKNENLSTMMSLDEDKLKVLADVAWRKDIKVGEKVVEQGDDKADFFYIVESGIFDILVAETELDEWGEGADGAADSPTTSPVTSPTTKPPPALGPPKKVGIVEPGGSFGELALMYNAPRAATVQAQADSRVWVIDRLNFKRMLMQGSDSQTDANAALLENVEPFSSLLVNEKRKVAEALVEMTFMQKECIIKQGDMGDTFYILIEGEVAVMKDGNQVSTLSANRETKVAQYFGERALLNNEPRAATIEVISATAKALTLDKSSFDLLLASVQQLMSDKAGDKNGAAPGAAGRREVVALDDLNLIGTLGQGAFGKVELREHKASGKTYAVKCMSKGYIVRMRMQNNVINEKHILESVDSQFIIKLYNTSQTGQWIYFFLEPAMGGELYVIYHRKFFHGSLPHARYYVASVTLAFEHLHERHVIYRDLKPENLLLTAEGHLKLTDMGLAKFALGKTYTTCGTPEYFAPEVIRSIGQTKAVDWWTLGILIYELIVGCAPFRAENDMAMYGKVLKGINHVNFPSKCDDTSEDLVKAMLKAEPSERLPMRKGGVNNLKKHYWYKGFDWNGLVNRTLAPPFVPAVRSHTDLRNFTHVKNHKANHIHWNDDGSGWDKDF